MKKLILLSVVNLIFGIQSLRADTDSCAIRGVHQGILALEIKLGGKEFLDLLNITHSCVGGWISGTIEGNLNVPALFSTRIVNGTYRDLMGGTEGDYTALYSFEIDTLENGKPLKARYEIEDTEFGGSDKRSCKGRVFFEGEAAPVEFKCYRYKIDQNYFQP